ncbi:GntR family transcriptional regulator (plasmid) [Falsihalocynthiibacter sp. SS001]|uniref:GntR family transcriptional regulator n=1 Tax=Falsihalocynthiibacter sp. SS001 TaxID=3349698 RepID=UPI0036D340E8
MPADHPEKESESVRTLLDIDLDKTLDRSRPLGTQIYEQIRLAIILEKLKPNDPISETELSTAFGVSRTPVREAYQRLIEDGLLRSKAKAGTLVAPIDDARVREGIIVRRALEREVVKIIATTDVNLRALDSNIALQSVAVSHNDHIEFFRQDENFHAALADLAMLPSAWRLAHSVKSHTDRARIMLTGNLPNRINVAFNEHLALVDALKAQDAELAQALISKHINSAFEAVNADIEHAKPTEK